ncbi:MAG TPA: sodium:proton antiporter [Ignavibacteriales bacterium]|nr:sodium:proton antiporter [Ignavibacteriales bacterium]
MTEELLIGISAIIVLGALAQWIAWRIKLPSILLLIITGILVGPVAGIVHPEEYFGKLISPVISVFVAIILFEGGLSLKIEELRHTGKAVRNLVTVGILVTWVLVTLSGIFILGLDFKISFLLGAILVVTGPTVIIPLINEIRLFGKANYITKWEGIVNDSMGALLTILVYEGILSTGFGAATANAFWGIFKTIVFATATGFVGALIIIQMIKHNLLPDYLQSTVSLAVVVAVATNSNIIQRESGLFAVTVMGIVLANQKSVVVKRTVEFKENLRLLLISLLFIVLSARIKFQELALLGETSFLFVAVLIVLVRPAAVFLSTINSSLSTKEKLFLSWMAPRGVVAASIASLMGTRLTEAGYADAKYLVPVIFLTIVLTIVVYGLSARPLSKKFGISNPDPDGFLILGAHEFARVTGKVLKNEGFRVLLADTNQINITSAKESGLETFYGNILSEDSEDQVSLVGIGSLFALTRNETINSLAVMYYLKYFESSSLYQVSNRTGDRESNHEMSGRILFGEEFNYDFLEKNLKENSVKSVSFTGQFKYDDFLRQHSSVEVMPMFLISESRKISIYHSGNQPRPKAGQKLIYCLAERPGNE